MIIDFQKYVEQKRLEKEKIAAEDGLLSARSSLARAYAEKGLEDIFESHWYKWDPADAEIFVPLMEDALELGLTASQIETLIIEILEDDEDD